MKYKIHFQDKYQDIDAIRIQVGDMNLTLTEVDGKLHINKWCEKLSEVVKLTPLSANSFNLE